jgi:tetratricopeptide (TPR) repeat protein
MIPLLLMVLLALMPAPAQASANGQLSPVIKQAEKFTGEQKGAEAIRVLKQYRPSPEESSHYHYAYAKAYEQMNTLTEAMAHLRLAYVYASDEGSREQLLFERAELYLKMGYYPEAAQGYRRFLRAYPKSARAELARLGIGDTLLSQGLFIEALLNYEEAGGSPSALFGKANVYQELGRVKDANAFYLSAIAKDREHLNSAPETLYYMAENFRLMGKTADAKIYYSSIRNPIIRNKAEIGLGLISQNEAKYDEAIAHFNSALQSPQRAVRSKALLCMADAYIKSGRKEDGRSRLMEIKSKYAYSKDYDPALLKLAQIYKSEGKFSDAVAYLKDLSTRRSPGKEIVDEFEKLLLESRDGDAAQMLELWKFFGHFLLDPSRSPALMEIANSIRSSGKPFLDLCAWLTKKGSPGSRAQCSLALADFYADMGDAAKAAAHIRGTKGKTDEILRVKAKIYRENRDYQKSMETVLMLKEMKPDDIVFFAELLETSKDAKKAVAFCEKALKNVGAPLKVYIKLADTLHRMGRNDEALKFYSIVASLKPENRKDLSPEDAGWTYYMVSKLSGERTPDDLPAFVQKGNTIYGKSAEAVVKEADILERMKRIN